MKILDVLNAPWAIKPEMLTEITEIYSRHLRGDKIDIKAIEAQLGRPLANERKGYSISNGVALLPTEGVMFKKANMVTKISGGLSMQIAANDLRAALADPKAPAGVILIWDTPGGTVDGIHEFAREILDARAGDRPVVSWVDGMMASAGVWAGTAADAVFIGAQTDMTGSLGIAMQHVDYSAQDAKAGVKTTDIYAGKYKRIASDNAPLSEEGHAYLQSQVDAYYSVFVDAVAAHRGRDPEDVLTNMADGRIFIGSQAIAAGLVDGVATLHELVATMAAGQYVRRRAGAIAPAANRPVGAGAVAPAASGPAGTGAVSPVPPVPAAKAVAGVATQQPAAQPSQQPKDISIMNKTELIAAHPDMAKALEAEYGTAGATAERARIQDVLAQGLPGHEALVQTLAFDGKTTGPEAAVQILAAEKKLTGGQFAALKADAPKPAAAAATATGAAAPAGDGDGLSPEQKAKADWDKSAALRAEFNGDEKAYMAFAKADHQGRVRVLGRRAT